MLESDDIAEIVDVSIENAISPIRVENRRIWVAVKELQEASTLDDIKQRLGECVTIQDFVLLRNIVNELSGKDLTSEIDRKILEIVDTLPKPKNGTSITIEDVRPFIIEFIDNKLSLIEPSKDGIDGRDGKDGVDGRDGIDGTNGTNGKNGIDGKDGENGKDGIGVAGALIDRNGELLITCTNGDVKALGVVVGTNGTNGVDGRNGNDGRDGRDGENVDKNEIISDVEKILIKFYEEKLLDISNLLNERINERIKEFCLTSEQSLRFIEEKIIEYVSSVPLPKDGRDGKDGKDGVNGNDGKDGENGKDVDENEIINDIKEVFTDYYKEKFSNISNLVNDIINERIKECFFTREKDLPLIEEKIIEHISAIPLPKNGEPGKSVTLDEVVPIITDYIDNVVSSLPVPRDGNNGKDGNDGKDGENGKSVTLDEIIPTITNCVDNMISSLPAPKDGKDGKDGKDIDLESINQIVLKIVSSLPKSNDEGKIPTKEDLTPIVKDLVLDEISKMQTILIEGIDKYVEIPEDIASKVAKAAGILAESPIIQMQQQPMVLNITAPSPPPSQSRPRSTNKLIVTKRDADGNLVSEVTEV